MNFDLKTMKRSELEELINQAQKALELADERQRQEARNAAERAAAEYGFSLEELSGNAAGGSKRGKGKRGDKAKSAPRYANPNDPGQTWTGKGRRPKWFLSELEKGKQPEDLEI